MQSCRCTDHIHWDANPEDYHNSVAFSPCRHAIRRPVDITRCNEHKPNEQEQFKPRLCALRWLPRRHRVCLLQHMRYGSTSRKLLWRADGSTSTCRAFGCILQRVRVPGHQICTHDDGDKCVARRASVLDTSSWWLVALALRFAYVDRYFERTTCLSYKAGIVGLQEGRDRGCRAGCNRSPAKV